MSGRQGSNLRPLVHNLSAIPLSHFKILYLVEHFCFFAKSNHTIQMINMIIPIVRPRKLSL
jgi:hypothetical protein